MKYRMHPVQEHNMQLLWLILHGDLYINMQLLLDALGSPGVSVTLHGNVTGSKACIGEQVMYTCTVGGAEGLLWYSATFGEITMACRCMCGISTSR